VRMIGDPTFQMTFLMIGLWWPNQTKLMTPEGLESWIIPRESPTVGVHPDGYYQLVDEYHRNHTIPRICPPGFPEAFDILTASLDNLWNGTQTAAEALRDAVPAANEVLAAEA
jgi:hypothetical protein